MATKNHHRGATAPSQDSAKARRQSANPAVVAVYIVLGLLVIGTSFYTGYLVGKSAPGIGGTVRGSGSQTLTVVEYSDFQCPFCQRAAPTVEQLRQQYGDKIQIVYKEFPLESLHPNAFNAALAAECVRKQGGDDAFWKYHDTLFAHQDALDVASLKSYATQQGLDIASCLDSQETAGTVRADMADGQQKGVSGTPSFLVGDELVVGAVPYETLSAKVDQKLSGAPSAPAAPTPDQQAPAAPQKVDVAASAHVIGSANAPVLIVEFTDYQCPFCGRAHQETFPMIKSQYIDTGKVRYSVRNYPLPFHENAEKSAEAAECVAKIGGNDAFWKYHDTLFAHQDALDVASLKSYATAQGIDAAKFASCLDGGEMAATVKSDLDMGNQDGVSGTPTFFVNGNPVVGAQPFSAFQSAIDAELAK